MKNYYLNYKDENGNIYDDLVNGVRNLENVDVDKFYKSLNDIINVSVNSTNKFVLANLPIYKPMYLVGTLINLLRDMSSNASNLEEQFSYIENFSNCEIDVFMIVNYLKEK